MARCGNWTTAATRRDERPAEPHGAVTVSLPLGCLDNAAHGDGLGIRPMALTHGRKPGRGRRQSAP